ncbi:hypothetical protein F183_A11110 [Bryobacterales bacterium F-183]|nr:hypothetical protein F183_A11110 [Bryobacterales bacterium F-183]
MSLARRALLLTALPVLVIVCGTFFALDTLVRRLVAADLSGSLAESHALLKAERLAGEERTRQALAVLAESTGLKAGLLLRRELDQAGALTSADDRRQMEETLREQVRYLRQTLNFDLYILLDAQDTVLASHPEVKEFTPATPMVEHAGAFYQMVTVPVTRDDETVGFVAVGSRLHLDHPPALLLRRGRLVASGVADMTAPPADEPSQLAAVGRTWVASYDRRGDYTLVNLREVDSVLRPALESQRIVLALAAALLLAGCFAVSYVGAKELSRPLRNLSGMLERTSWEGELPSSFPDDGRIAEVAQLSRSFETASGAIRLSRARLEEAYVDFMGAIAEALDARDAYTAGHSRRVADYGVCIARAIGLPEADVERIRLGGMLHDIGKIGVPDRILHKHERLTDEEFAAIKEHPAIGKRILERIGRFEPYLPAVELHHENHDGTGYPYGLRGDAIPLDARILHVADAYDAMTSDRPYRQRMPEDRVRRILRECAGTQFDPAIVDIFLNVRPEVLAGISNDLEKLSHAITDSSNHRVPGDGMLDTPARPGGHGRTAHSRASVGESDGDRPFRHSPADVAGDARVRTE